MAKRGKYMSYNGRWDEMYDKFIKNKKVKEDKPVTQSAGEHTKVVIGRAMYDRVAAERYRHGIGENVIINRLIWSNEKARTDNRD